MKPFSLLLASATAMVIISCSSPPAEVWTAKKKTDVFASDSDIEEKIVFSLTEGDTCTPIREHMKKSYLHTEIQCAAGRGWVIDKQNFSIKSSAVK